MQSLDFSEINIMDITIKDLTEGQVDTVRAFAHAVKEESVEDIELFNIEGWSSKKNLNFLSTLNYRIKPQPSYLDLHKASGLKVGDKVKINTGEVKEENGYKFSRRDQDLRGYKLYEGQITYNELEKGFWVDGEYLLPYYALEKIEEEWIVKHKYKEGSSKWYLSNLIYNSRKSAEEDADNHELYDYEFIKIK